MIDLETAGKNIADLHAAQQYYTQTANDILASVLAFPVNLAGRVLQAINPDWWPHGRYRQLAAAFGELCADMPGEQPVNVQMIHSHLLNTGALKDGDFRALWNELVAPGTHAPCLLEPQVMQLVRILNTWHFRIVWHTIFKDPEAFTWPIEDLKAGANKRFERLQAAGWPYRAQAVKHVA